jgi:hypothetical protein
MIVPAQLYCIIIKRLNESGAKSTWRQALSGGRHEFEHLEGVKKPVLACPILYINGRQ